ncbi:MAG: ATP-binding cassette, subfamily multidrug efflux pump [Clostridia bacterium]|nr:ATP-binding cassette, subfamily multidrug efflux pump [Clostridia bacterium]
MGDILSKNRSFQEKEIEGKVYDLQLLRRILSYAKPYWLLIVISVILVFIITAVDLARPYLIKIAIDEHIKGYTAPMVSFLPEESPVKGVHYKGRIYVRETELSQEFPEKARFQLIKYQGKYFLIQGVINPDKDYGVMEKNGQTFLKQGKSIYQARPLSRSEARIFREKDIKDVTRLGLIYFVIVTAALFINYGQNYLLQFTSQKIVYDLREDVFTHLQKLSLAFFDKNPVGRLVTRVTNDTATLNELFTEVLINMVKDFFIVLGIIIIMLKLNWKLAIISYISIPLTLLSTYIYKKVAQDAYRKVRVKLAELNSTLQENISGMRIVQIFGQQYNKFKEFDSINLQNLQAEIKALKAEAFFRPSMDLIYSFVLALLVWYGGRDVLQGTIQFGVLYAFINYTEKLFRPINDMTQKFTLMQNAVVASERIFMLLDEEETISDPLHPKKFADFKGEIVFKDVWFAYEDEEWVLKDVSFEIKPGETVAFVGPTGSGKTTITNLITRLYNIQKGEILIDGINIKDLKQNDIRKMVAVVMQDVFLFSGNILSNITLDSPEISEEKAKKAARYVNAEEFIKKLPGGYNYEVKERGATLSAGQRQLIAFARALAFDPKVLILDEATASIDTQSEILIQDALNKLTAYRTTIVIAHRLSTIKNADKIIVLHKGRIKEMGTHHELLAERGMYYRLYKLQWT